MTQMSMGANSYILKGLSPVWGYKEITVTLNIGYIKNKINKGIMH